MIDLCLERILIGTGGEKGNDCEVDAMVGSKHLGSIQESALRGRETKILKKKVLSGGLKGRRSENEKVIDLETKSRLSGGSFGDF